VRRGKLYATFLQGQKMRLLQLKWHLVLSDEILGVKWEQVAYIHTPASVSLQIAERSKHNI